MKDIEIGISTCASRTDRVYKFEKWNWSALCARLSQTRVTGETLAEYLDKNKDDQTAIKDVGGYVCGDLKDGHRGKSTILSRSVITLDLDYAPADFWKQFTLYFDKAAALHSTHKHRPRAPKFRLLIPLTRAVDPGEYEAIARKLASEFMNIDWCDDTTFQPSRLMFWPSTSKDAEYVFQQQDGEILDPSEILNLYDRWDDVSRWPYSSRVTRRQTVEPTKGKQANPLDKDGPVGWFCKAYSIQDAIRAFIPEIYTPTHDENRWTYANGSTSGGFVVYDSGTLAYSNHATDPAGATGDEAFHCVNAFDLVRIHKFRDLDKDAVKQGQKGASLPSYKAMVKLVQDDEKVQQLIGSEMFSASASKQEDDETGITAEQYQADNAEWFGTLSRNVKTNEIEDTIENVLKIIQNDTKLANFGGYNEFDQRPEKFGNLPWWRRDPLAPEWTDADTSELIAYIEKFYSISSERVIKRARDIIHNRRKFHPVREYLDSLEWDGVPRLDTLLIDYLNAADNLYTRTVTRKAIVAAVKRIYEPGCKFDYILTFSGPQGIGKTQIIKALATEKWTNDSLTTFTGKEAYEALSGSWFVEVAELTANKRSEVETAKQFISKQDDKFRKAYAECAGVYRRQCIFIGTTNRDDFLRDATGNRRWWIVKVDKGARKSIFTDLPGERDQIFAEAKARYLEGETLYLPPEIEEMAQQVQENYMFKSAQEDQITEFLSMMLPGNWQSMDLNERLHWLDNEDAQAANPPEMLRERVCLIEIWVECLRQSRSNFRTMDQREIADILTRHNWRRAGKRRMGKPYGVLSCYTKAGK